MNMKPGNLHIALALLAVACASGCAGNQYYFAPKEATPLTPAGVLGATFAIPEGQEKNSVRIFAMGVRQFQDRKALVVRYYFENFSAAAWKLDVRRQRLRPAGGATEIEALGPVDSPKTPVIQIPFGVSRLVDLGFPINGALEGFELSWEITTPKKAAQGTTDCVRALLPDGPAYASAPQSGKKGGGRR